MPERFESVLSRAFALTTWLSVGGVVLIIAAITAVLIWTGFRSGWPTHVRLIAILVPSVLTVLVGGPFALTWAYSPRAVVVSEDAVTIERIAEDIVIPFRQIREVRPLTKEDFRGTIRTFGAGGPFGRIGHFHSPALGNFRMYVTDMADAVIIDAEHRYVLSPRNRERFIALVRSRTSARGASR